MARRFRGYLPVVVDVETGGFNAQTDALLELAAVTLRMDSAGRLHPNVTYAYHIQPFAGARLDPSALAFNGINPHHPLRIAVPEAQALQQLFHVLRTDMKTAGCTRAILTGHNPTFDLNFVNAAAARCNNKRNPFHPFSTFDTATLGGLAYGQTVLARAMQAAGLEWDDKNAHSARYDAERTAALFCDIVNRWDGFAQPWSNHQAADGG